MYDRFLVHNFNSLLPKASQKTGKSILKTRMSLGRTPRQRQHQLASILLLQKPKPNFRIKPQAQSRCSLWPLTFPGLWLLGAEKLLCVLDGILDTQSAGKTTYHLDSTEIQICGKEELVFVFALCNSLHNSLTAHEASGKKR